MSRHVVFGTGQVGRLVVEQLVAHGHDVIAVNRNGAGDLPGAQVIAGDAGDTAVHRTSLLRRRRRLLLPQRTELRPLERAVPSLAARVLAGAASAGARLVVLDNLYAYGPPRGRDLVETMAPAPTSDKSATRAAMTEELLLAHAKGDVEVVIGRASDYYGPGTTRSALGESVFGPALTGRTAQVMGDPRQLHSYSYTPDVSAALVNAGHGRGRHRADLAPAGRVGADHPGPHRSGLHTDGAPTPHAGRRPLHPGRVGLIKPMMREYQHTLYQFTDRWVVDDAKYRGRFGERRDSPPRRPRRHRRLVPRRRPRSRRLTPPVRPLTSGVPDVHHADPPHDPVHSTHARVAAASLARLGPRDRRIHRPRHRLRVPPDPRGAHQGCPVALPREPDLRHHVVPRPGASARR